MGYTTSRVVRALRTKLINTTAAAVLIISGVGFAAPMLATQSASAATTIPVCASCANTTIQSALTAATAGDTIDVQENQSIAANININKQVVLTSSTGATIDTTAANQAFTITAAGTTVQNLTFTAGLVNTAVIGVQAANVTITNNIFTGSYTHGAAQVSRALVLSGTAANVLISGNQFHDIRQPAYINAGASGTISNNFTETTKGFVVEANTSINFTGNTWGTGSDANAVDIAIIAGSPNNYNATTLAQNNNAAVVDDQVTGGPGSHTFTTVYVQASAPAGGDGTWLSPFNTIQAGINATAAGGTVNVLAGTYYENVVVNKAVTVLGAGAASTKIVATNANATPLTFATNNATVSGFTITHEYTPSELSSWNFNNNGVFFAQGTTGNTLSSSTVTLSRNGVYLNNSQGNIVTGNTITNNRTGINLTNNVSNTQITNNVISNNWTLGLVYYSQGFAANFDTVNISGNTFSNNWYSEVVVKDAGASTGTLDLRNNTFSDNPITYSTSSDPSLNEPGFAAQKPVALGGSATPPTGSYPTIRIYNSASMAIDYTPTPTTPPTTPTGPSTGGSGSTSGSGGSSTTSTPAATTTYVAYYDGNGDAVVYGNAGTVATEDENTTDEGEVKGESTDKSNSSKGNLSKDKDAEAEDSAFLGLGWWWIPVILVGLGVIYWAVVKRSDTTSSTS